ncbi:hypothetical protein HOY80DRAFT_896651, partial [Tuber brumale]
GDYDGSKKTPDLAWTPCINDIPRDYPFVVMESGLSESDTQLINDSWLWLEGTGGVARVVALCKPFAPDQGSRIKVTLSIYIRLCQMAKSLGMTWYMTYSSLFSPYCLTWNLILFYLI